MRDEVARDLSDSAADFMATVWPAIRHLLGGGRLVSNESAAMSGLMRDFDVLAGIDAWHAIDEQGVMRGIASRIQWGENWRTFTIRRERPNGVNTELAKRLYAIDHPEHNWLVPAITVQAYLTKPKPGGRLLQAGIIRTRDLYQYARANPCRRPRRNPEDGVWFDWYSWADLSRAGYRVGVVQGSIGGEAA